MARAGAGAGAGFGVVVPKTSVLLPSGPVAIHLDADAKTLTFTVGSDTTVVKLDVLNMDGMANIHPNGDMYYGTVPVGDSKFVVHFQYLFTNRKRPGNIRTIKVESYTPPTLSIQELVRLKETPWTVLMSADVDPAGTVVRTTHYPRCPPIEVEVVETPLGGFRVTSSPQ